MDAVNYALVDVLKELIGFFVDLAPFFIIFKRVILEEVIGFFIRRHLVVLDLFPFLFQHVFRCEHNILIGVGKRWYVGAPEYGHTDVEFVEPQHHFPTELDSLVIYKVALLHVRPRPYHLEHLLSFLGFAIGVMFVRIRVVTLFHHVFDMVLLFE